MPVNRNALLRYKTIDKCLKNRYRSWTLNDLIDACSEALYEYEGSNEGVSKRSVQGDIQIMRSDKLGYNAPIIVIDRKYYIYENPDYSITNIPITDKDLNRLGEVVQFLKQFKGFTHFKELSGMVQKLENHVYSKKENSQSVIDFEKNENLKGLEFIDTIYHAIVNKHVMRVEYKSFKARDSSTFKFHAYLLKEFNNRWFVLGRRDVNEKLLTLALDRILEINKLTDEVFYKNEDIKLEGYFKDVIGVTVNEGQRTEIVEIFVDRTNAPYVITKPLHHSQKIIEKRSDGVIIKIEVKLNFELERLILGFGETMQVIKPQKLRNRIMKKLNNASGNYAGD